MYLRYVDFSFNSYARNPDGVRVMTFSPAGSGDLQVSQVTMKLLGAGDLLQYL